MSQSALNHHSSFAVGRRRSRRIPGKVTGLLAGVLALVLFVTTAAPTAAARPAQEVFPEVISLPNGFRPEGIAIGYGTTFYVGSIPTGAIYRGDLLTGEGEVWVQPQEGRAAIGLEFDPSSGNLFVAGGPTGMGFVYDGESGELLAGYTLTPAPQPTFINDVFVTREAAYFTDSQQPLIYRVPLGPGGALPDPSEVQAIPLSGDYVHGTGFNANGITATPDGKWLIIVQSNTGLLFRVDPLTGDATLIELAGGATVPNGDGILLDGRTLYVVQNRLNQIAVIDLSPTLTSGEVVDTITDSDFGIPTTIDRFGSYLYAVNAHFPPPGQTPDPNAPYEVVQVSR